MHSGKSFFGLILCLSVTVQGTAVSGAETPLTYDRVNLSVSASAQVENDTTVAVLYVQREGTDAAQPAGEVNERIRWALDRAKGTAAIEVQTLDYRTTPIYRKETLSGWRVRQSLRLQSTDATALSTLIGDLQARLAVESVSHTVSPDKEHESENRLIAEAIDRFQARAQAVTGELGRQKYRLVQLDVNTSVQPIQRVHRRVMATEMAAVSVPPSLEAGTRTVQVHLRGTIELQLEQ